MLEITIPDDEIYNEKKDQFIQIKGRTLQLEHSLLSLKRWEAKWHKPFLSSDKNKEEMLDYIRCMTLTSNVDPNLYRRIPVSEMEKIKDYISDPMTATTIQDASGKYGARKRPEIITAEVIYYWMIALQVPPEYQKWHLNQLLTLIQVCNIKNNNAAGVNKKMSKREILARNRELNEMRRRQLNTSG